MRACAQEIRCTRGYPCGKVKTLFVLPSVDGEMAGGRTRTEQDISTYLSRLDISTSTGPYRMVIDDIESFHAASIAHPRIVKIIT
jgi:hypothetical protein